MQIRKDAYFGQMPHAESQEVRKAVAKTSLFIVSVLHFILALVLAFGGPKAHAATTERITVKYVSVYDGDTIVIDAGVFSSKRLNRMKIRIPGIDTPEMKGKCEFEKEHALAAKTRLQELLADEDQIVVVNPVWDKYGGRIEGQVVTKDGTNVAKALIKEGFAVPYDGKGARRDWCQ